MGVLPFYLPASTDETLNPCSLFIYSRLTSFVTATYLNNDIASSAVPKYTVIGRGLTCVVGASENRREVKIRDNFKSLVKNDAMNLLSDIS